MSSRFGWPHRASGRRASALAVAALLLMAAAASEAVQPTSAAAIPVPDPPSTEGRVRIPMLGIDAPLTVRQVAPDGTMPMPLGPADVSWYDFSIHPGLGGVPVASGNTILSGHVDYVANVPYTGVRYSGPGVFADLGRLRSGASIEVVRGPVTASYRVVSVEVLPAEQADWLREFAATPVETLTLFTCTGEFNPRTFDYSDRVVVKAVRVIGVARKLDVTPDNRFLYGIGGTSDPVELAAAQTRAVTALYARDPAGTEWLTYVPGAPSFVNTLVGRLRPEALVIGRVAQ